MSVREGHGSVGPGEPLLSPLRPGPPPPPVLALLLRAPRQPGQERWVCASSRSICAPQQADLQASASIPGPGLFPQQADFQASASYPGPGAVSRLGLGCHGLRVSVTSSPINGPPCFSAGPLRPCICLPSVVRGHPTQPISPRLR